MCIDGDGLSEIVAMFTLAEETKEVRNSRSSGGVQKARSETIMSDKDLTKRDAFTSCFPGASLPHPEDI